MRVVAGKAKGRKLAAVPGSTTRPILDRVKTALFDILRPELDGSRVLDLFAGSGSVGIEALSQGASFCVFTELEQAAVATITGNLEHCQLIDCAQVILRDAFRYLKTTKEQFDLIYVAPPQYHNLWAQALQTIAERPDIVSAKGLIIAQIDPREYEALQLADFEETRQKRYGNTLLVFYSKRAA